MGSVEQDRDNERPENGQTLPAVPLKYKENLIESRQAESGNKGKEKNSAFQEHRA